jgi:alginate O-acetyltransferase complex protein AlgI
MLFNSIPFIVFYLPIVFAAFFLIARISRLLAALWLALASLFFYGWWDARYVTLLLGSVSFNYTMGWLIAHRAGKPTGRWILASAVTANLILLGIFKYADFFIGSINAAADTNLPLANIVLPLGISFFTFTQIAFLVDAYRGIAREYSPVHYLLFVTYFPHLIAGPVLHHKQMMPQFELEQTYRLRGETVVAGLSVFVIGLAKKVVLADSVAGFATPVFAAADQGTQVTFFDAWGGALAYTFQLYFDFSGYSDMAIGLSLLFGIQLPLNFSSPYRAPNIIEFWRRWHMTLSQFLRDYLYIPLGGNRKGPVRRHVNLMITMLLGGLWHGASWTFVFWGGLHGAFLVANHVWRSLVAGYRRPEASVVGRGLGVLLTFLCVVVAWVFFRAETFGGALSILQGMSGQAGFVLPDQVAGILGLRGVVTTVGSMPLLGGGTVMGVFEQAAILLVCFIICWCFPNTQSMSPRLQFLACTLGFAFVVQAVFFGRTPSEFLYFQF